MSRDLSNSFPSLGVHFEPAQTVLHGHLHDQAELAGVFNHLDMLGIDILEVTHLPPETPEQDKDLVAGDEPVALSPTEDHG